MNRRKPYWIQETADPKDDQDLTPENQKLLQQERLLISQDSSPILAEQWQQTKWIPNVTQRCGLIAIKLGMYPLWTKEGKKLDCTVLQVDFGLCAVFTRRNFILAFWLLSKTLVDHYAQ